MGYIDLDRQKDPEAVAKAGRTERPDDDGIKQNADDRIENEIENGFRDEVEVCVE